MVSMYRQCFLSLACSSVFFTPFLWEIIHLKLNVLCVFQVVGSATTLMK